MLTRYRSLENKGLSPDGFETRVQNVRKRGSLTWLLRRLAFIEDSDELIIPAVATSAESQTGAPIFRPLKASRKGTRMTYEEKTRILEHM